MTSETDLSTADLAQPGGTRPQDRADDEQRRTGGADEAEPGRAERNYETSGNRVAQSPADDDTVTIPQVAPGAGSTRNDALQADDPYPGRADTPPTAGGRAHRDAVDGDMGDRDMGDRGMADRGMADRDMGDRDMGDRGSTDRGAEDAGQDVALLDEADSEAFRRRWSDTQARFVDDPQEAVQTADGLVAELMQTLASSFSQHKGELEAQWRSGGDPGTEELRQALQRYRSFFDRLLSA